MVTRVVRNIYFNNTETPCEHCGRLIRSYRTYRKAHLLGEWNHPTLLPGLREFFHFMMAGQQRKLVADSSCKRATSSSNGPKWEDHSIQRNDNRVKKQQSIVLLNQRSDFNPKAPIVFYQGKYTGFFLHTGKRLPGKCVSALAKIGIHSEAEIAVFLLEQFDQMYKVKWFVGTVDPNRRRRLFELLKREGAFSSIYRQDMSIKKEQRDPLVLAFWAAFPAICNKYCGNLFRNWFGTDSEHQMMKFSKLYDLVEGFPENIEEALQEPVNQDKIIDAISGCLNRMTERMSQKATQQFKDIGIFIEEAWEAFVSAFKSACSAVGEFFSQWTDRIQAMFCVAFASLSHQLSDLPGIEELFLKFSDFTDKFIVFEDVAPDSEAQAGPEHLIQWICAMISVLGNFDNDTRLLINKSFNMMPDIGMLFKKAYQWMMYVVTGNERYVFGDFAYKILEIGAKVDTWIDGPDAIMTFQNNENRRKMVLAARTNLRRMKLSAARSGYSEMNRDEGMMIQSLLNRLDNFIQKHTAKPKTKSISRKPPLTINLVGDVPGQGKSFITSVFVNLCLSLKSWYEEEPREFGSKVGFDISNSDYDDGLEDAIVLVISEFMQSAQIDDRTAEVLNFIKRVSNEKLPLNMSEAELKGKCDFSSEFVLTNSNVMPDLGAELGVTSTSAVYRRGIWVEVECTRRFNEELLLEKTWKEVMSELGDCWNMKVYCERKFLDGIAFVKMAKSLFPNVMIRKNKLYDQCYLTFGEFVQVLTHLYVFHKNVGADESTHTFTDHVEFFNEITNMDKKRVDPPVVEPPTISEQTKSIGMQLEEGLMPDLQDGLISTITKLFQPDEQDMVFTSRESLLEVMNDFPEPDSESQCQDLETSCTCPAFTGTTRDRMFEMAYNILVELKLVEISKENNVNCYLDQQQMAVFVFMHLVSKQIAPEFALLFGGMSERMVNTKIFSLISNPEFIIFLKTKGKGFAMRCMSTKQIREKFKETFPNKDMNLVTKYYYANKYMRYFEESCIEDQFNMHENIDWLAILGVGLLSLICIGIVVAIAFAIKAIIEQITSALETRYEGNPSVPDKKGRSVQLPANGNVHKAANDATHQSNKLDLKQLNNLTLKLRQNHVRVTLHYKSGSVVTTHATFLRAYTLCINKHVMRESVEFITIQPLNCAYGTGQVVIERTQYSIDNDTFNDDVVLLHFKPGTANLNMRSDLSKYLFDPEQAEREYDVYVYEDNKFVERGRISRVGDFHCDIGHFMNLYAVRGYKTQRGDCGRLYVVKHGNSFKILGMHTGRHNDLAAMVVPLDNRDLHTKLSDSIHQSLVCTGIKLDADIKPIIKPTLEQVFPGAIALGKLPGHFYSAVGPIEHELSCLHPHMPEEIVPMLTKPITRTKENVFKKKALNKDRNSLPLPPEFTQIVENNPLSLAEGFLKDHLPYKDGMSPETNWDRIAFGSDLAHGINPKTSGGSYDMLSKNRAKKANMMEAGQLAAEFIEALDKDDTDLRSGVFPIPLFNQAAKAELLPPEKENPRPFSVAGLKVDILYRKYIGKGLQVLGINPSFRAVLRYNPHGYANEYVRKVIHKFPNLVELDVKTMDDSISPVFAYLFALWWCETVCGFVKGTEEYTATFTILSNITNYMFFMKDGVYQAMWGLPSGHLITAVFNAFVNHVILKFMNLCLYPMLSYDECMSFLGLGDDLCGSVSPDCPLINQLSITAIGAMFGLMYTGGDKKPCTTPYQGKVGFLSREWREIEGRSVHALKKSSLYGILHWKRKGVSKQEYLNQTMNVVLMESFYHGREFFNQMYNVIVTSYNKVGFDGTIKDWNYFYNRWNCTYTGGMIADHGFTVIDDELMNWFDNQTMTELGQYLY